ncbi:hypothetical protein CKAH01_02042 [Colletotrichum kahawae]|uniref:Uncharacterized protein n=1 Tax=Colletotrichum kahawae TaxID=34407 RepID=A0AAD9Y2Q6_COLKA|nr:hypothetical protein CKAH01_02042 [Colletotrichum kahawae]
MKSKHGPKTRAACGKEFSSQPWNIKRHISTCSECKRKKDQHDISTSLNEQNDDVDSLGLFDVLHDDGTLGQYDSTFGGIVNDSAVYCDYEEFPLGSEHEQLKN